MNKRDFLKDLISKTLRNWDMRKTGLAVLAVAVLHGLVYVFMIPPWWHHEEGPHLEYALLAQSQADWPQPGEYDNAIRQEIGRSMIDSGWGEYVNLHPGDLENDPLYIGISQVGDPPLYAWVLKHLLTPFADNSIETRLYVGRLFSLLLYLVTIWLAWISMPEIVSQKHPLRWMIPLFLALLPSFADGMTAIHNDAIGTMVAGIFVYLSLRWLNGRLSLPGLIVWAGISVLLFFASTPAKMLIVTAPLVVLLKIFQRKSLFVLAPIVFLAAVLFFIFAVRYDNARFWISNQPASVSVDHPNRFSREDTLYGNHVIAVTVIHSVQQFIPPQSFARLQGNEATLGVWIWAESETPVKLPGMLYPDASGNYQPVIENPIVVQVTTTPRFFSATFDIPAGAPFGWLYILPEENVRIFYDGFILVPGDFSAVPPQFTDNDLRTAHWDGHTLENLIRNPSAEASWVVPRRWLVNSARKVLPMNMDFMVASIQDIEGYGWYHMRAARILLKGFWAQAAGSMVDLPGRYTLPFMSLMTLFALPGLFIALKERPARMLSPVGIFTGLTVLILWTSTFLRGGGILNAIPYVRYTFPVYFLTALILLGGLYYALLWLQRKSGSTRWSAAGVLMAFFAGFSLYSALSFGGYFHANIESIIALLFLLLLVGCIGWAAAQISAQRRP